VVVVAAEVVADGAALVVRKAVELRQDLRGILVLPLRALQGAVRLVDVGLVVLVVVRAHRLLVDVRLERAVVVREVGHRVGHVSSPSS
jgi:hypothetical protein